MLGTVPHNWCHSSFPPQDGHEPRVRDLHLEWDRVLDTYQKHRGSERLLFLSACGWTACIWKTEKWWSRWGRALHRLDSLSLALALNAPREAHSYLGHDTLSKMLAMSCVSISPISLAIRDQLIVFTHILLTLSLQLHTVCPFPASPPVNASFRA